MSDMRLMKTHILPLKEYISLEQALWPTLIQVRILMELPPVPETDEGYYQRLLLMPVINIWRLLKMVLVRDMLWLLNIIIHKMILILFGMNKIIPTLTKIVLR